MTRKLLIGLLLLCCSLGFAKGPKATIIVVGNGDTKEKAVMSALRSAIEQTCGTFVFSNTEVRDRKLVIDEICSISGGNIASYKELSCASNEKGVYVVTLEVKIGISEMCSKITNNMSEDKSIEVDLSELRDTYLVNAKLRELHRKSEAEAIEAMISQVKTLIDKDIFFVDKFSVSEPIINNDGNKVKYNLSATLKYSEKYSNIDNLIYSTLNGLSEINFKDLESFDEGTYWETKRDADCFHGFKKKCKVYLLTTTTESVLTELNPYFNRVIMEYGFYEDNTPISSPIIDVSYTFMPPVLAEIYPEHWGNYCNKQYKIPKSVDFKVSVVKPLENALKSKYKFY